MPGATPDAMPRAFGVVYSVYTIFLGIALLTMGLEVARSGTWQDWTR